jgi:hypothetical protein
MFKWFTKRIFLGLIIIPSVLYIKDAVFGGTHFNQCVRYLDDKAKALLNWKDGQVRDAYSKEIEEEEATVKADIDDVRAAIEDLEDAGATEKAAELEKLLSHLIDRRDKVLDVKKIYLAELNEKQIAIEKWKMMKVEDAATKANFASARNILNYEKQNARFKIQADTKKLAGIVNGFLDSLKGGKTEAVKSYCTAELQPQLTATRMKTLRKSAPNSEDFNIKPGANGREYEVLFDGEVKLKLAKSDGEWKVKKVLW